MSVVKFKIGFTIDAETLFAIMAKMLPIENLSVEEIVPTSPTPQIAPKPKRVFHGRKSPGPNLSQGINRIIMEALEKAPHRALEISPLLKKSGFSPNSTNSRLEALRAKGVIEPMGDGRWRKKLAA